jgi:tRNA (guanine-N7-)-methyltransferase
MTKRKLQQWDELKTFPHVFQFPEGMQGTWNEKVFNNQNPIVVELACGKGEYTVNLSQAFPDKNFVGVDIKGHRIFHGAKMALERKQKNTAFLRTDIEKIDQYFAPEEISEIWITFPDPQPQLSRVKKRLTHPRFLNLYKNILRKGGVINLKTDSTLLYEYTLEVIEELALPVIRQTADLYKAHFLDDYLSIKTFYEEIFTKKGEVIKYVQFVLH